jgi:L,D-peptidoglycan transpeptidase YkuD (ErfK/YbiS/YcfS/YnhG family)
VVRPSRLAVLALSLAVLAACGGSGTTSNATSGTGVQVDPGGVTSSGSVAASTTSSPRLSPASPAAAAPSRAGATTTAAPSGQALPLALSTGSATQVITVVAASGSSTSATLQAWDKAANGWLPRGAVITARLGSDGLSASPSEARSATPIGSFALTRAFGIQPNPGTGLTYTKTTLADWWISQAGPLYNTFQTCSGSCPFTQGDPNEHLATITPQYNYAVVIEYNTGTPATPGAGSAFFLHVTDGSATAGCVSIPSANLVAIMQWLNPAASPRILIGVG